MRKSAVSSLPACLTLGLLLVVGCGRIGFDDAVDGGLQIAGPLPIVAEDVIGGRHALTESIAGDGFAVLVAQMGAGATQPELVILETDASGVTNGQPAAIGQVDFWPESLRVLSSDNGYHAFFHSDSRELHTRHFSGQGELLGSTLVPDRHRSFPVRTDTGFAVTFIKLDAASQYQTHVVRLDVNGNETGLPVLVETSTGYQIDPKIAASGDRFGVIWRDDSTSPDSVRFAVLGSDLLPIAPSIGVGNAAGNSQHPSLIRSDNAGGFLVAWEEGGVHRIQRFDANAAPLWPAPVSVPPNIRESQDFDMVVWESLVVISWQADDRSYSAEVNVATIPLEQGGTLSERTRVSPEDVGFCCPSLATGPDGVGILMRGSYQGRRGPFMRVWAP